MHRLFAHFVSLASVLGTLVVVLTNWSDLPSRMPRHFDATGAADAWGPKGMVLVVPVVSILLYGLFSWLERIPGKLNYPVEITRKNRAPLFELNTHMIATLKAVITVSLFFITLRTIQTAEGSAQGLGAWFLPTFLTAAFAPIVYFVWRMSRLPSSDSAS